jgi:hypothetical protein
VPRTILNQATGALIGEGAEQVGQSLTGTQGQGPLGQIAEMGQEGVMSTVGGFAMSPFVAIGNVASGAGVLKVGEEGIETIRAAKAVGLDGLVTPGMVSGNPLVTVSENQARVLVSSVKQRHNQLAKAINLGLRQQARGGSQASDVILGALKRESDRALNNVQFAARSASKGGKSIQQGIAEYELVQKAIIDRLYNNARSIETPQFDFTPVVNAGKDLQSGIRGRIDPEIKRLLTDVTKIKGPITLSDGTQLSIYDQLKNIRTAAFAKMHIAPGEAGDLVNDQGRILFKALNDVLDNPVNANPNFVKAWKTAAAAASDRFKTLERMMVVKASKSENPADLLTRYAKPFNVDNLLTLRQTVEPKYWNEFTDSFRTELLRDPYSLSKTLKSFDEETLNVLIPRAEQAAWKQVASELDRITAVGADTIADRTLKNKAFVSQIITGGNPGTADTVIRSIMTLNDPARLRSYQAGIMDWATTDLLAQVGRDTKFNGSLLKSRINTLKEKGFWKHLSLDQRQFLQNNYKVSKALKAVADAGVSIRATEIAAGVPQLKPGALRGLAQSYLIGHFNLSPIGRRIMIGTGKYNSRGEFMRAFGGALAQVSVPQDLTAMQSNEPE